MVAVDEVPAATPVTVTRPAASIATMPSAVAVPAQVYASSKLVIWTVKPSAVAVGVPNVGVSAAINAITVVAADVATPE